MPPVLLGLAGGSGSGKSTVAGALVAALGERCLVVQHDRYYHSIPPERLPEAASINFDHPDSLDTARLVADLRRLQAGETVALPRYDFAVHRRTEAVDVVAPRPVILVDGILVLAHPTLRDLLDYRVFVDAPPDIRLMRRIRRDVVRRGRTLHDILEQYERTVRPMHLEWVEPSRAHADLVLDGTGPVEASVAAVLELLP